MSSHPPDDNKPYPGDWLWIPKPLRGARVLVGAILSLLMVTAVLWTYLRIEQQLQATLEERLTGILHQQVNATVHFVENVKETSAKAASVIAAQGLMRKSHSEREAKDHRHQLDVLLSPWIELGAVAEISIIERKSGELLYALPSDSHPPETLIRRLRSDHSKRTRVDFEELKGARRIYAWSPIPESDAVVVASIVDLLLIERLNPVRKRSSTRSYAYGRDGWLTGEGSDKLQTDHIAPFPTALLHPLDANSELDEQVSEYLGRQHTAVVGAWTWLPDYEIGIATEVPRKQARAGIERLRQSSLILITMVAATLLGFIVLGRWTLRVRQESQLMTQRLSRLARTIQPLSAALEHDPSAVILVDQDGTVVYANAAAHRLLSETAPLIGQDADRAFERLPDELQSALASGQDSIVAQGGETDGETILVSSHSLAIEGTQHFLYMLRPVTQQVRRQEVEHWKKLIRVLSHELNNALAPITSLLSSARKVNQMTHQDPRLGQIFESINERTAHLVSFIESYREVARLPRPAPKVIAWESFLTSIESQKQFQRLGDVPDSPGFFDPIQLERVIVNLINNSYEADSPRDQIEICITEDDERFRIDVMDRGTGMPEAVLKQAMLPFFSTKRTGTGVGLALSREIIEAHGGQLALANREGGGLIVSCSLPKAAPPSRLSMGKILASNLDPLEHETS